MPETLVIRTDASIAMGTGHVMRCLALAQTWRDEGGDTIFAMVHTTPAVDELLRSEGMVVERLAMDSGSLADSENLVALARDRGAMSVVDGYHFGLNYQLNIKNLGSGLLFIDDNGHAQHYYADIVLNQNVHASEELYSQREPYTQLLLGPRFAMLRREFATWRNSKRSIAELGRKVLVCLGGSDPENVTAQVIDALRLVLVDGLDVVVVVGGSNPHAEKLKADVSNFPGHVVLRSNVQDMAELMAWADAAILGGGSSCWEMCLLGLPAIIVPIAKNQIAASVKLTELGIAQVHKPSRSNFIEDLSFAVTRLLKSPQSRTEMSTAGKKLVDGRGAARVTDVIRKFTSTGGTKHVRIA